MSSFFTLSDIIEIIADIFELNSNWIYNFTVILYFSITDFPLLDFFKCTTSLRVWFSSLIFFIFSSSWLFLFFLPFHFFFCCLFSPTKYPQKSSTKDVASLISKKYNRKNREMIARWRWHAVGRITNMNRTKEMSNISIYWTEIITPRKLFHFQLDGFQTNNILIYSSQNVK